MTFFLVCLLIVVVTVGAYWWLLDDGTSKVNGVRIRIADQKHFSGFYVAVDKSLDEVVVVGQDYWGVRAEVVRHGLIERVLIVPLPGEPNELLLKLMEPQPLTRKGLNDASLN